MHYRDKIGCHYRGQNAVLLLQSVFKYLLAIYLTLLDYYEQKSVRERQTQRDKSASEPLPL